MSLPTHRLRSLVLLVAVTIAAVTVAAAPPARAACSDVDVAFARGTGESPGLGVAGRPFVEALTSALPGRTVSSYAVDYAANSSQSSAGPGATDMVEHVESVAASCPGTQFVIGGYSQGATVTSIAVGIRTGTSTGRSIPAALADRVVAVVVFGNPLGLSGGATIATRSATYGPKSRDYCNSSDNICGSQPKTGTGGHLSYVSNGSVAAGGQFAAGRVATAPTTPGTPPGAQCITATNSDHVAAGRATAVGAYAYAAGSRDYLGRNSSIQRSSVESPDGRTWNRVRSC